MVPVSFSIVNEISLIVAESAKAADASVARMRVVVRLTESMLVLVSYFLIKKVFYYPRRTGFK